ncbi:MAG: DNA polymerase III subunit alpha [Erysipelotrichaceae bacterium]
MCVQLHLRSYYSLLQSPIHLEEYIQASKSLGYTSVALTDFKSMHGCMHFYKLCKKYQMKGIYGLEVEVLIEDEAFPFLLLAKSDEGFINLMKCSSYIYQNHSILTLEEFKNYHHDCFIVVYGEGGYLEKFYDDNTQMRSALQMFQKVFNEFIVAISYNDAPFFKMKNEGLKKECLQLSIETMALSKIYYLNQNDQILYKIIKGIKENLTFSNKLLIAPNGRYLRSIEEMKALYDIDDLTKTIEVAKQCNVTMTYPKTTLPSFQMKDQVNPKDYLKALCIAGLKKRLNNQVSPIYVKRLKEELDVILSMHFENYFLIVYDFVRYAKSKSIYVGPGRGSAAGSLDSYCLGITHIDPIEYGLLFERFLNPERISMPDIDLDIPDNRRQEVIEYVLHKYGNQHFAQIVTFNTLAARQVIRDVARVYDIPLYKTDMICKSIPNTLKITLQKAYDEHPPFRQLIHSEKRFEELFEASLKLEGIPRHTSIHAGGIVISDLPLSDVVPVMEVENGMSVTQYTMEYLEDLGLIKMDLLGLRNLSIIDEISKSIQHGHPEFDIFKIPLDDKKTFELIQKAHTLGVFQLESSGMKKLLKDLKPETFIDVASTIALFRPGPMQNIPLFIKNRSHPQSITYLHPDLKPVLNETYGVIIYQEQIMQIAQKMAGFTLAKADILRKAMSKKLKSELEGLQKDFVDGCIQHHYTYEVAVNLYDLILKFADYGFNKSHSVAYGLVSYQLAYLKVNYPLEFYRSLLNSVLSSESKTSEYIYEAKEVIGLLGISVNKTNGLYQIDGSSIRLPFTLIKGVGNQVITNILQERDKGLFVDYYDFIVRMCANKMNKKTFEALIDAGALDEFNINRHSMLKSLDDAMNYADLVRIEHQEQILIDFNLVSKPIMVVASDDKYVTSQREKQALGFYFSSSPIKQLKTAYQITTEPFTVLKSRFGPIKGFGCIQRVKQHRTKKGTLMAFVLIQDDTSEMDLVIMPDKFERFIPLLVKGNYILFEGLCEKEGSCIVKKIGIMNMEGNHG